MYRSRVLKKFNESEVIKPLCFGILVGALAGIISVFYRYLIHLTDNLRKYVYGLEPLYLLFSVLIFIAIGTLAAKLLKWAPFSGGSGIPQIKAELEGQIEMKAERVIVSKLAGGSLLNIVGFSLGREGPSIQTGGMVGKLCAKLFKLKDEDVKMLISAGAAAGLSAAFNAPIAGVMFCVEELHKEVSHRILVPTIAATTVANSVSYLLMGNERSFSFRVDEILPLKYIWVAVIIGIATGIIGMLFNRGILKSQNIWNRAEISMETKMQILVVMGMFMGILFFPVTGGGHGLVENFAKGQYEIKILIAFLILKMMYTVVAYGSGAQGGIFLPVLVLGAIVGSCVYQLLDQNIFDVYLINFIILGMVGILSAVVRAPILAIILVLEMTGNFSVMLMLAVVSIVALVTAELLNCPPIYDSLYDRIVSKL